MKRWVNAFSFRLRQCAPLGLAVAASIVATLGYRSEASARNSTSRWDEECWFEGCDNEEREEMWDLGSGFEEGINEQLNKTSFSAVFEMAELGSPTSTTSVAWGYCTLMMDDFDAIGKITTIRAIQIHQDCSNRWSQGAHRSH